MAGGVELAGQLLIYPVTDPYTEHPSHAENAEGYFLDLDTMHWFDQQYAGGRELTLGDLGTRDGLLGGINAVIVGNYLTTLGRDPKEDLALLEELEMPIKALNETL